jgi:hypothetical protein
MIFQVNGRRQAILLACGRSLADRHKAANSHMTTTKNRTPGTEEFSSGGLRHISRGSRSERDVPRIHDILELTNHVSVILAKQIDSDVPVEVF